MKSDFEGGVSSTIQSSDKITDPLLSKQTNSFQRIKQSNNGILTCCLITVCLALIIIVIGLPISQVIVGSIYKNACPVNPLIPIYLIIAGIATLLLMMIYMLKIAIEKSCLVTVLQILIAMFCLAWYITGTVWVFRTKKIVQYYDPEDPDTYCHYSVFNFAYGTMFFGYGFLVGTICYNNKSSN